MFRISQLLRAQRDREIAAKYRRAYCQQPQEPWFAEASAQIAGERLAERSSPA